MDLLQPVVRVEIVEDAEPVVPHDHHRGAHVRFAPLEMAHQCREAAVPQPAVIVEEPDQGAADEVPSPVGEVSGFSYRKIIGST